MRIIRVKTVSRDVIVIDPSQVTSLGNALLVVGDAGQLDGFYWPWQVDYVEVLELELAS